jgi:hypothetical protein
VEHTPTGRSEIAGLVAALLIGMARGSGFNATKNQPTEGVCSTYTKVYWWNQGTGRRCSPRLLRYKGASPAIRPMSSGRAWVSRPAVTKIDDGTRQFTPLARRASASPQLLELTRSCQRLQEQAGRCRDQATVLYEMRIFTASKAGGAVAFGWQDDFSHAKLHEAGPNSRVSSPGPPEGGCTPDVQGKTSRSSISPV